MCQAATTRPPDMWSTGAVAGGQAQGQRRAFRNRRAAAFAPAGRREPAPRPSASRDPSSRDAWPGRGGRPPSGCDELPRRSPHRCSHSRYWGLGGRGLKRVAPAVTRCAAVVRHRVTCVWRWRPHLDVWTAPYDASARCFTPPRRSRKAASSSLALAAPRCEPGSHPLHPATRSTTQRP